MTSSLAPSVRGTGGVPNLQLIDDYATTRTRYDFQIHTQVKLKWQHAAERLRALLEADTRTADQLLELLKTEGEIEDPFHLELLVKAGLLASTGGALRGTGGVPNLMVMYDFAKRDEPSWWFQLHTQVELDSAERRDAIRKVLASGDSPANKADRIYNELIATGSVEDKLHLKALLEAALAVESGSGMQRR